VALGVVVEVAVQHHIRAEAPRAIDLAPGGVAWHDDPGVEAEQVGGVGERLGVVAAGGRDNPALPRLRIQAQDGVQRAAHLEAVRRVDLFQLEQEALAQAGRGFQRRGREIRAQAAPRPEDVLHGDGHPLAPFIAPGRRS